MQDLSLTLVQPNPAWHKVEENLANYTSLFSSQSLATDIVLLPEMFTTGFTMEPAKVADPALARLLWPTP